MIKIGTTTAAPKSRPGAENELNIYIAPHRAQPVSVSICHPSYSFGESPVKTEHTHTHTHDRFVGACACLYSTLRTNNDGVVDWIVMQVDALDRRFQRVQKNLHEAWHSQAWYPFSNWCQNIYLRCAKHVSNPESTPISFLSHTCKTPGRPGTIVPSSSSYLRPSSQSSKSL